jgi:hypothetical protein
VNLLPLHNIRQTLRIQGVISPLINTSSWDGTYVRTATDTQQTLPSFGAKKVDVNEKDVSQRGLNQNYPRKK